jgi:hypothetical protein
MVEGTAKQLCGFTCTIGRNKRSCCNGFDGQRLEKVCEEDSMGNQSGTSRETLIQAVSYKFCKSPCKWHADAFFAPSVLLVKMLHI